MCSRLAALSSLHYLRARLARPSNIPLPFDAMRQRNPPACFRQICHPSFGYRAVRSRRDAQREYNNDKSRRSFYFPRYVSGLYRKFRAFVRPGRIPSLSGRGGVKFLTMRILRERTDVLHFTYTRSSYDGNQHVDQGERARRRRQNCKEKRHSTGAPRGADRMCTESTPFSPLESRGGKSSVPRANFGKHRR